MESTLEVALLSLLQAAAGVGQKLGAQRGQLPPSGETAKAKPPPPPPTTPSPDNEALRTTIAELRKSQEALAVMLQQQQQIITALVNARAREAKAKLAVVGGSE